MCLSLLISFSLRGQSLFSACWFFNRFQNTMMMASCIKYNIAPYFIKKSLNCCFPFSAFCSIIPGAYLWYKENQQEKAAFAAFSYVQQYSQLTCAWPQPSPGGAFPSSPPHLSDDHFGDIDAEGTSYITSSIYLLLWREVLGLHCGAGFLGNGLWHLP